MNKKLLSVAASLLAMSLVFAPSTVSATTYVNDADITAINTALDALDTYTTDLNDSSVSASTILSDGTAARTKLDDLSSHSFVTDFGSKYTDAASKVKTDAGLISADIGKIDTALQANDEASANAAVSSLSTNMDSLKADEAALNDSVDQQNKTVESTTKKQTVGYLALLIATVVLAAGSFMWARRRPGDADQLYQARRKVAIASIWPVVGAGITYGTFAAASKTGGTYYIAYGPMLIGAALYFRGVGEYKLHKQQVVANPLASVTPPAGLTPPIAPVAPLPPAVPVPPVAPPADPTVPAPPTDSTPTATPPIDPTPPAQPPTS